MRSADPASWNGLAAASSLWRVNADTLVRPVGGADR
jgi:hypothetical protein